MEYKDKYQNVREQIKKDLNLKSVMQVPVLEKIVLNMGIGSNRENKQYIQEALNDLEKIAGQKPSIRKATKSISNFKLREGQTVGYTVTLRGDSMWNFYEKFVKIVVPRIKDFQGLKPKAFDKSGNYSVGLNDHSIFQEVDANTITFLKPLQITFVTKRGDMEKSKKLFKMLDLPIRE